MLKVERLKLQVLERSGREITIEIGGPVEDGLGVGFMLYDVPIFPELIADN